MIWHGYSFRRLSILSRVRIHEPAQRCNVRICPLDPGDQPVAEARVAGRLAADRGRLYPRALAVCVQFGDDFVMCAHADNSANWHKRGQVPNDTLPIIADVSFTCRMAHDFRHAFIWHLDRHGTKLSDLVNETGVSRDVLNKLKARENSSTTVENAMLIAAYYGKSISDFIALKDADEASAARALFDLLTPEERRLVEAQIRGILRRNEQK
ncbi:helix-turn-helix transcriptional regulator [Salipiger sp. 1_MG-2023]|uniref:helix-turn-helix domain-containing protein n=1 Tax=Salipiger sp. 1_MG-2023 TaxID=3062665 RepID=UPI0026E2B873|nr:helix-turn-helix transcriptional regulator [Salipiger sp. 1_MG-2023]MDO6587358.1 helix-turn-helix transcriptional regulator [Salipiger sp. 1_MG-2023]